MSFETTEAGYRKLAEWLEGFGPVIRVGVEGPGSYGTGLARLLHDQGIDVVGVDPPELAAATPPRQIRSDGRIRCGPSKELQNLLVETPAILPSTTARLGCPGCRSFGVVEAARSLVGISGVGVSRWRPRGVV